MTRYYHNENPQVEVWMEQARRNQELAFSYKQSRDYYKKITENLLDEIRELESAADRFNRLPWYKKAIFSFKL